MSHPSPAEAFTATQLFAVIEKAEKIVVKQCPHARLQTMALFERAWETVEIAQEKLPKRIKDNMPLPTQTVEEVTGILHDSWSIALDTTASRREPGVN